MKIIAKTTKGQEYIYSARTAHRVNQKHIETAIKILNQVRYKLNDGETWYAYEVDRYDNAYYYSEEKRFTYSPKTGILKETFPQYSRY